ncbi:MAG: YkgJ family cysteine cluster protein [Chloroflexi bacterium]|nr:YkgJ family cysteine cluster protein [Chloroflexota bacterium]
MTVFKQDLFSNSDDFGCQQCGLCCRVFCGTEIEITEKDLSRWEQEDRKDILEWVDFVNFGDHIEIDFPIHPTKNTNVDRCPFLRKLPRKEIYICRINDTKPTGCREFPVNRENAQSINCPGIVAE